MTKILKLIGRMRTHSHRQLWFFKHNKRLINRFKKLRCLGIIILALEIKENN